MIYQREDPAVNGSRSRLRHRTNKPRFARQPSASAAVDAAPLERKGDVASAAAAAAVNAAPAKDMADAATAMIQALPRSARQQTIGRLVPDQHATNKIWMWIVITFAIVLGASIVALIGAIFVSAWHKVDPADVQVLLTVVTTVAGILAGFIGGRASKGTG